MFHITQYGKRISRHVSSRVISSSQSINGRVYRFETRTVKYVVHSGVWWCPAKTTVSIMINGTLVDKDGTRKNLGTKEYPSFVPKFIAWTRENHILARRQYMTDVGKYLGYLRASDRR